MKQEMSTDIHFTFRRYLTKCSNTSCTFVSKNIRNSEYPKKHIFFRPLYTMSDSPIHRDPFPLTTAQLFGNFCETLFYGIYLVTCLSCVRVFLDAWTRQVGRWGRSRRIRWLMTMTALALFTICTFDTVIGLVHNIQAFVHSNDPEKEFVNLSNWITIARVSGYITLPQQVCTHWIQSVNQVIAMLIGDFILVWCFWFLISVLLFIIIFFSQVFRCWIIYGRQYLIILPSLTLFLVDLAMAAKLTEIIANPHVTANMNVIIPWWLSFLALTAAQNTLTTRTSLFDWIVLVTSMIFDFFFWAGTSYIDMAYLESREADSSIFRSDWTTLSKLPSTQRHSHHCRIGDVLYDLCCHHVHCKRCQKQCSIPCIKHRKYPFLTPPPRGCNCKPVPVSDTHRHRNLIQRDPCPLFLEAHSTFYQSRNTAKYWSGGVW